VCNQRLTSAGAQPKFSNVRMRSGVSNDTASSKGRGMSSGGNNSSSSGSVWRILRRQAQ
jgi:hypothetical protein